ncbi:agouti-related protein [Myotis myotis]|uniref:Agouti-related protein n=2 Tax=Myotis myotis TaxID=51298 RepID=A0A7J7S9X3_MYOMY|nr:agouti-related protein [Myotis myotis]KAF6285178.1 agouti related neuropeptide [Myotis myotis]
MLGARIQQAEAMLTAILSCALLLALPAMEGAQMSLAPLEGIRRPDEALFSELSDLDLRRELKRTAVEQAEEVLLQEAKDLAEALDPEEREPRSLRRCVRLHESCLGHQVPCCDPCATCYCRFFNAFCYCRKLGTAVNPCSRT